MNIKLRMGVAVAALAVAAAWYWAQISRDGSLGLGKTVAAAGATAEPNKRAQYVTKSASVNTIGGAQNTFLPGHNRTVTQVPGPTELGKKSPGWWLLARTPAEVEWLNMHGYPTPAEERMLASLSDAELAERAKGGDFNAKTHEAVRSAMRAFASAEKLDKYQIAEARNLLAVSLHWSGPYGASKVLELSSDLVSAYYLLPEKERTEAKRQVMAGIYVSREIALALSIAYGDHTHNILWGQSQSPLDKILPGQKEIDGRGIGYTFARASEERMRLGLGPVILTPRPVPEEVVKGGFAAYREFPVALERQ